MLCLQSSHVHVALDVLHFNLSEQKHPSHSSTVQIIHMNNTEESLLFADCLPDALEGNFVFVTQFLFMLASSNVGMIQLC